MPAVESDFRVSLDVDRNGQAILRDPPPAMNVYATTNESDIAPWLDVPPTPPPKSSSFSKAFFPPKVFPFASQRQNSSSSTMRTPRPSESQASFYSFGESTKRPSQDDSESSRGVVYSGSSTNSGGDLRSKKSSRSLVPSLGWMMKRSASRTHLREDMEDNVHPSLKDIVPLPEQRAGSLFTAIPIPNASSTTLVATKDKKPPKKHSKDKGKQKASQHPPAVPPKDDDAQEFNLDSLRDLNAMDGILRSDTRDVSSPSSGFDSAYSHSDTSSRIDWNNPFAPATSVQDKKNGMIIGGKISPKSTPPHALPHHRGSRSPGWSAPDSWVVEQRPEDSNDNHDASEVQDSGSDEDFENGLAALSQKREKPYDHRSHKHRASGSQSSLPTTRGSKSRSSRPSIRQYKMRIYVQSSSFQVVSIGLDTTVADINELLRLRHLPPDSHVRYDLYVREQGRGERMLGPKERPALIVKNKMEQAGYDAEDGQLLLGPDSLGMLMKFHYKSQLLSGEEQINLENFTFVDLAGKGLRTIPVICHQNADSIISLRLDRNPMLEIPLDFIQSCTTLRDLWLTHMSMKKVPSSIRHCTTLHRLNLGHNSIKDLEDAHLEEIEGLLHLCVRSNRLEKLPRNFPQLRGLVSLNISNNKFNHFPLAITELENLHELDISFNMITELPKEIGKMRALDKLAMVGNQVASFPVECLNLVSLRILDCRRNLISDVSIICMLPNLQSLSADHNCVHSLDLAMGPQLTTFDVSHNDITRLSLIPGPMSKLPYALTMLDLSYGKLSSLDDLVLSQLSSLRTLKLDHNSIRTIPESLGDLHWLEILSCTDNKLNTLPSTIGKLQKLKTLDAHNNSLTELPQSIWNCASLEKINVTSNFINGWHDPPTSNAQPDALVVMDGSGLSAVQAHDLASRRPSTTSVGSLNSVPPLVHSLEKLYLGENCLTDNVIRPLMIFKNLRVLNMSFNEIQDLPPGFFRNMVFLEELYLSGNRLTNVPAEDFPRLTRLTTLFLNGNKLSSPPHEIGKVPSLTILDIGSNLLKYNINNWEFDWNWNFNTNLKYLNLSGNKRLQIKADRTTERLRQMNHRSMAGDTVMLSGFTNLSQLKVLGLMDVTITTAGKDTTVDIPDENMDRRVRTSLSTVCGMGYGIADSLGKNDHLNMIDLVHEFHSQGREGEAILAMFGQTRTSKYLKPGTSPNRVAKFLHDNFVNVFKTQLAAINEINLRRDSFSGSSSASQSSVKREGIKKALAWTFLKLNQDLHVLVTRRVSPPNAPNIQQRTPDANYFQTGASGVALYFVDKTIYAANVGDALAVVSRQGVCHQISKKHDPYDRMETARIRAAEGSVSAPGLLNEEVEVSRSFGYFHVFPTINARPDIFVYDLSEMDEFVIIANRGLWNFVPYQTAVDIARTVLRDDKPDPMLAAQKLRDFAISYGAVDTTMIMVIHVADLFKCPARSRQPTIDPVIDPYKNRRKEDVFDSDLRRLPEIPPPIGHVTLVFTDIRNSTHLWEVNPGMPTAIKMHNNLFRRQLRLCGGYEVKTEGDAFMCSFPTSLAAVWWCLTIQAELLNEPWPLEILECEDGKPRYDKNNRLIARGISVRMGIHSGYPLCETDVLTRRMDYFGPMVNRSARINSKALGGQIMCSLDIVREINAKVFETEEETEYSKFQTVQAIEGIRSLGVTIVPVGEVKLKGIEVPEILSALYPRGLEGRHELKEPIADPTASGSRVQFSVPQIKELGLVCLRLEALSAGRIFKPLTDSRKASIQSNSDSKTAEEPLTALTFYGDPNILLPPINDSSTDADLMLVLYSLSLRIVNAVTSLFEMNRRTCALIEPRPRPQPVLKPLQNDDDDTISVSPQSFINNLAQDGRFNQEALEFIASFLSRSQ
ncbi:hypothetical protein CPC08DRAFT_668636 [Agrocybe pediades]|nr:hypothetical protein CPC08DRAFT_668636 [Agrocybe pediades]